MQIENSNENTHDDLSNKKSNVCSVNQSNEIFITHNEQETSYRLFKGKEYFLNSDYFKIRLKNEANVSHEQLFFKYPIGIFETYKENMIECLKNYECLAKSFKELIFLSDKQTDYLIKQDNVKKLNFILEKFKDNIGVFFINREPTLKEKTLVVYGLKNFLIKDKRGGYRLGFSYNNQYQSFAINLKDHSELLQHIDSNQLKEETRIPFLEEYFMNNNYVFKNEAHQVLCAGRSKKLYPSDNKQGLFSDLFELKGKLESVSDLLEKKFNQILTIANDMEIKLNHLIDFGQIICPEIGEKIKSCLKEFSKAEWEFPLDENFLFQMKSVQKKLVHLIDECLENEEAVAFISKLVVMLDFNSSLENSEEALLPFLQFQIGIKFLNSNAPKAFEWFKRASESNYSDAINAVGKCYENGNGIEKNYLRAVISYEAEMKNGDRSGIAKESIENLKINLSDPLSSKQIGRWYALEKRPDEALFWLKKAASFGANNLNYLFGNVSEQSKKYQIAFNYFIEALNDKDDDDVKRALNSIEDLERKFSSEINIEIEEMLLIADCYKKHKDSVKYTKWVIRAAKNNSTKAVRSLKEMIGKNEFKEAQLLVGQFFESTNDFEKAMKCYKKINQFDQADEKIKEPWKYGTDNENIVDEIMYEQNYSNNPHFDVPYLPIEKMKPTSIFYQSGIEYSLKNKSENIKGLYTGTLSELELKANGLGEWKFEDKINNIEVRYKGEWKNGEWHGFGDLHEKSQFENSQISIEISRGIYCNGKLHSDDGCSDAHICINRTLADGKILEIHFYGPMKESNDAKKSLSFLKNCIFSKNYYFHEEFFRAQFKRLVHLHIISNKMGNKLGYEIVGNWMANEESSEGSLVNIIRNDFEKEKNLLIHNFKEEIKKEILKSNEESRFSILGIYLILNGGQQISLEELIKKVLNETEERICTKSMRNIFTNLNDLIQIQYELKYYAKLEKDFKTSAELKTLIEDYIKNVYSKWLQSFNAFDTIPNEMSFRNVLCLDPNVLKMMAEVRIKISDQVKFLNVNFELNKVYKNLEEYKFVQSFQDSWKNYLTSTDKINQLSKLGSNSFYASGWSGFKSQTELIKTACEWYLRCVENMLLILMQKKTSKLLNQKKLESVLDNFYEIYLSMFSYEFHLDISGKLVDYEQKNKELIISMFESLNTQLTLNLDREVQDFKQQINLNFILSITKFYLFAKEKLDSEPEHKETMLEVINQQMRFIFRLNDTSFRLDRIVNIFMKYLNAFLILQKRLQLYEKFPNIKNTLEQISVYFLSLSRLILSNNYLDKGIFSNICDLFDEKINFITKIANFPQIIDVNECTNLEVKHPCYDLLANIFENQLSLFYKFSEKFLNDTLKVYEIFFDALSKMFDVLLDENLDESSHKKIQDLFEYCKNADDLEKLSEYLLSLKNSFFSIDGAKHLISITEQINDFIVLNKSEFKFEEIFNLFTNYETHFKNYVQKTTKVDSTLKDLVEDIKKLAKNDQETNEDTLKENLLSLIAGLVCILTVSSFEALNTDSNIKFKSHNAQVFGCLCLFLLKKNNNQNAKSVYSWLTSMPKQLIATKQTSFLISILCAVYSILDFEVTVVYENEYVSLREKAKLDEKFYRLKDDMKNIRFTTIEQIISEELDGNCDANEKIAQLAEQILYKSQYDDNFEKNDTAMTNKKSLLIISDIDMILDMLEERYSVIKVIKNDELAIAFENLYDAAKKISNKFKHDFDKNEKNSLERFQLVVRKTKALEKFERTVKANKSFLNFINNQNILFKEYQSELWESAMNVANFYSNIKENRARAKIDLAEYLDENDFPLFRLNKRGTDCEYYFKNKWSALIYPRYLNAFFYLELFARQTKYTVPNKSAYGYLKLDVGFAYYSSIIKQKLNMSSILIAMTSSYQPNTQKDMLIRKFFSINEQDVLHAPLFSRKKFINFDRNDSKYFKLLNNKESWLNDIEKRCNDLFNEGKTCVVFFKNENDLKSMYQRLIGREPFYLTNNEISVDKYGEKNASLTDFYEKDDSEFYEWKYSIDRLTSKHFGGKAGGINLIMSEYASWINFENDSENGLTVIQTWFSADPKHEEKLKSNFEQNQKVFNLMQILNLEDLNMKKFSTIESFENLNTDLTYDQLSEAFHGFIENKYELIQNNLIQHDEKSKIFLKWVSDARKDRTIKINSNLKDEIDKKLIENYFQMRG